MNKDKKKKFTPVQIILIILLLLLVSPLLIVLLAFLVLLAPFLTIYFCYGKLINLRSDNYDKKLKLEYKLKTDKDRLNLEYKTNQLKYRKYV